MAGKNLLKGSPKKKKRTVARRGANKNFDIDFSGAAELSGEAYGRLKQSAFDNYRLEYKGSDYKRWVLEWCKNNEQWKSKAKTLSKLPDSRFGSTVGGLCHMLTLGCPDVHEAYNKYWESLAGTMGTPKPLSESVNKFLSELYTQAESMVEEVKKAEEEKEKKEAPVKMSIQDRIRLQSYQMSEKIDEWLEVWLEDFAKFNPKGFDIAKHLREVNCTQAHARKMKEFYIPEQEELQKVLDIPTKAAIAKLSEDEQEDWNQLSEAYSVYPKKQIQVKVKALDSLNGALDVIINTAKANRKPRKRIRSKEKMVAKMKYAVNDDKFQLVSINPQDIIGASELWVFNIKTRKLGKYVARVIDPLHQGREGSGLSVKGTTIQDFDEEKSIQKTLRKPEEKLKEFQDAGKRKIVTFLDEINAVDIKLNGRINAETILLKAIL